MTLSDQFIAVGIDVSKAFLDVAVRQESVRLTRFPNTPLGQNELSDLLTSVHCGLAVLEATGGYEAAAACLLQSHGHPVAVVNPRRVRAFAQSMGFLAKTDRADAVILAEFAAVLINKPDVHKFLLPVKDSSRKELEALMTRRNQLIVMHTAERQRLRIPPMSVHDSGRSRSSIPPDVGPKEAGRIEYKTGERTVKSQMVHRRAEQRFFERAAMGRRGLGDGYCEPDDREWRRRVLVRRATDARCRRAAD